MSKTAGRLLLALVLVCLMSLVSGVPQARNSASAAPTTDPVGFAEPPVLAHYYIWYTPASWNRAKSDWPLAGRYSSDDVDVMRRQVQEAKSAGIDGFIVSWKSTPSLNARLAELVQVAAAEHFVLAITYQGLDFNRAALPSARIGSDLDYFIDHYGSNEVFDIFGKPLVVLTGTPVMGKDTIASITKSRRDRLLILGSAKSVADYDRIADEVDGNLYYWSSVNPATNRRYPARLAALGAAVHAKSGIWIAPVAPGFDARLVGGKTVVDRLDGDTLRREWDAARRSQPTCIGIISWNEYSENTHIEPSRAYGQKSLSTVAELLGGTAAASDPVDSSAPGGQGGPLRAVVALGGLGALLFGSLIVMWRRSRRPDHASQAGT